MTPGECVQVFNAKRIGRGKWIAKCPAHSDKHPSLSIAEGKKGMLVKCMSNGCDTRDVMAAVGLKISNLFYQSRDISSEALKKIRRQQYVDRLYEKERCLMDLRMMIRAVENPPKYKTESARVLQFEARINRMCDRLSLS